MDSKELTTFVIDHMPLIGLMILVFGRLLSTVLGRTQEITITLKLAQPSS